MYLDKNDRQTFLDVLGEVCSRMQWVCYAYCLMTNHYHLVVKTPAGNLSSVWAGLQSQIYLGDEHFVALM